jgi:hypothetical protein
MFVIYAKILVMFSDFFSKIEKLVSSKIKKCSSIKVVSSNAFKRLFYTVIFFWAKLVRNGRIRAVAVRPQKFRANFSQFGRISSIAQPKNLLNWENFAQIERNSPEILGAKLNCAGSPISGEKNNYCVRLFQVLTSFKIFVRKHDFQVPAHDTL